ncbi:unnamed protein product [Pedinophyceae sp. YPF-701]|nr:unnamed protein product [Pedinophyceae sp. YPF-701]
MGIVPALQGARRAGAAALRQKDVHRHARARLTAQPSSSRRAGRSAVSVTATAADGIGVDSKSAVNDTKYVDSEGKEVKPPPKEALVEIDRVDVLQVVKGVTMLRCVCKKRLKPEIEYGLNRGSCDNTYVVHGTKRVVLVDAPDEAYCAQWMAALPGAVRGGSLAAVTDLIVTHISPFRVPSLKAFLRAHRDAGGKPLRVYLSNPAEQILKAALAAEGDLASHVSTERVRGQTQAGVDNRVDIGGSSLDLTHVPTPRWPDLVSVYQGSTKILFSSKLFSCHAAPAPGSEATDPPPSGGWDKYGPLWRHYFECMLAPVARQALSAREKLAIVPAGAGGSDLWRGTKSALMRWTGLSSSDVAAEERPAALLCPLHGPAVCSSVAELLSSYDAWLQEQLEAADKCTVAVLYASAYGNTTAIAQAISRGITKAGVGVEMVNLESATADEVAEAVRRSSGFAIGSPTLGGHMPTQVQAALGTLLQQPNAGTLPAGVFGSFGWSGEAVDEMYGKLKDAGYTFAFDPVRIKFKPDPTKLQVCEECGTDLAQEVRKRQRRKEQKVAGMAPATANANALTLAMGRIVGALCVVTARSQDDGGEGKETAMLASWVSQASFDPPGITVAVKKDRAIEPLLTTGAPFSLSILAEGKEKQAMRHLTKPFKAGEDRLSALATKQSEMTKCSILADAASYVDARVESRMDAGDHWVVYAMVTDGKVLSDSALTAVHHRKVGSHY